MTAPAQRKPVEDQPGFGLDGFNPGLLNYIWPRLDQSQRSYITMYYHKLRKLNMQATEAWTKRANRLSYILAYCEKNKYTEHNTREKITNDWVFNDANDDWLRYCREIKRCEAAMRTELQFGLLIRTDGLNAG